jgi:hypothetical protein
VCQRSDALAFLFLRVSSPSRSACVLSPQSDSRRLLDRNSSTERECYRRTCNEMPRKAAISLVFVALLTVCNADESTIEYSRVQKAQNLSGVIRDQTGEPIPQVAVEEMSDDWSAVLQHTMTDAAGHWSLPVLPGRRIHSIRFLKSASHQLRFRVELTQRAKQPLDFQLPVS